MPAPEAINFNKDSIFQLKPIEPEKINPIAKQIERFDKTTPFKVVIKPNDKFEPYLQFQRDFLTNTYNWIAELCDKYQITRPEELPVL